MKKFKRIALILGITLLLAVMGVVSVSAHNDTLNIEKYEDFKDTSSIDPYISMYGAVIEAPSYDGNFNDAVVYYYYDGGAVCCVRFTDEFTEILDIVLSKYKEFGITEINPQTVLSYMFSVEIDGHMFLGLRSYNEQEATYGMTPEQFLSNDKGYSEPEEDDYYYYVTNKLTLENIDRSYFEECFAETYSDYIEIFALNEKVSSLEGQVTELNNTITEKDAVITEKDSTISTLEGEKTALENDVDGLNTQVSALTTRNTQLNATVKSLENQMQLKINKAYAEGLTDSEGDLTTSGIISVFIVILTIGEVVALVMFFVSRAKRRKKNKR